MAEKVKPVLDRHPNDEMGESLLQPLQISLPPPLLLLLFLVWDAGSRVNGAVITD